MKTRKKKLALGTGIIFIAIILTTSYYFYRNSHFRAGTIALGENISGKTVNEAYTLLNKANQPFKVKIKNANKTYMVKLPERYHLSKKMLKEQLSKRDVQFPKNSLFSDKLTSALSKLNLNEQPGKNAKIHFTGEVYEITPEIDSTQVNRKKLIQTLYKISSSSKKNEIKLSKFFIPVKINTRNKILQKQVKFANQFIQKHIVLEVNQTKTELTKVILASFLTEKYKLSQEAIKTYLINTLSPEVSTFDKDVLWKNPMDGKTYKYLNNHSWGWDIKIKEATQILTDELTKSENTQTINLPIDGDNTEDTNISENYVWINLLDQMMHVYRNGNEVVATRIISGRNNKETATVPGFHTIGYKKQDAKLEGQMLDGSKYSVTVKYFEPLQSRGEDGPYFTGIGIHDSSKTYNSIDNWKTNSGSNGCINTPPDAMEQVWAQTYARMPVFITGDLYANSPGSYDKPVDFGQLV
ncbi:MAG: L,D-transpeptidase/peptidoglycan binding protein [Lactobacillales bacterium]|nr:L,D-transpeptidase/peptidoglycan binding protein [Lactobacillales bacterium]